MNIIKSSLSGLALVLLGELVGINLVSAQESTPVSSQESTPVLIHDTSIVNVKESPVGASGANPGTDANFDAETGSFSVDGLGENLALSPDVIQVLETQGAANGSATGNSGSGDSGSGDSGSGDSGSGDSGSGDSGSEDSGSVGALNNISINDLAKLVQADLQESMDSLVAAESVEKQPRRFARRRSSQNCSSSCVVGANGEPQSVEQLQAEVAQKTAEAKKFVQQINQLDPENNIW